MHSLLERMLRYSRLSPRCDTADFGRHIFRELNGEADSLANRHCFTSSFHSDDLRFGYYRLFFDGSVTSTATGGGWILYGSHGVQADAQEEWLRVASLSFPMGLEATITACELEACLWGVAFEAALFEGRDAAVANVKEWTPLKVEKFPTLCLAGLLQ